MLWLRGFLRSLQHVLFLELYKRNKDDMDLIDSFMCDLDEDHSCSPCAAERSDTSKKTLPDCTHLPLSCKQLIVDQRNDVTLFSLF